MGDGRCAGCPWVVPLRRGQRWAGCAAVGAASLAVASGAPSASGLLPSDRGGGGPQLPPGLARALRPLRGILG
eukprot:4095010-Alexandrium_andersonii.AAC.1